MMKYFANLTGILAVICLIALLIWNKQIQAFNLVLFFVMILFVAVRFFIAQIQTDRRYNQTVAYRAVTKFKKDHSLICKVE